MLDAAAVTVEMAAIPVSVYMAAVLAVLAATVRLVARVAF
jgi:hypothetical protein